MAIFQVEGGRRLHGEITPQGAKNEALQILCATLLTPERIAVLLDGSLPDQVLRDLCQLSHRLVVEKLPKYVQRELGTKKEVI